MLPCIWWYIPVIPALRRLRQKDHNFKASLGQTVKPCLKNNKTMAGCQWLSPIILAIQEAEIRRIEVQNQLGQIV
jgi:hypothetical protein